MIEQRVQTEAYWRDDFSVTDQDVEDLGLSLKEAERPMGISELGRSLVVSRSQREQNLIRRQLAQGTVYRPDAAFTVDERLVFPHLQFALGSVVGQRDGHNPEYGEFKVVSVQFDDAKPGKTRSFAAELRIPHKLASSQGVPGDAPGALSIDDLCARYGRLVAGKLESRLQSSGFVAFRGQWLSRAMLADLHVGHLNIAEAAIDVKGQPLRAEELLAELDLPDEIPQAIKEFSVNYALSQDERFDDVGDDRRILWSLARWEPDELFSVPARLRYEPATYDRTKLDVAHLQIEREIDDEASLLVAPPTAASARSVTLLLTYPHWRMGTLPLTARTRVMFPGGKPEQHTRIAFVDRASRSEFPGWVVHAHQFVHGLQEWYKASGIPVGAYVRLERTEDPYRVMIDVIPRRMQREWFRMAFRNENGELGFQMQKRPVSCEYDPLCVMDEADRSALDELWAQEEQRQRSLEEVVSSVFLELARTSPNGLVHSKTVYTAANVLKRCPPGPVFTTLLRLPQFATTSDGYWVFQERVSVR